ncbi:MAG: porin [Candidatus Anammoxibacter sp.]
MKYFLVVNQILGNILRNLFPLLPIVLILIGVDISFLIASERTTTLSISDTDTLTGETKPESSELFFDIEKIELESFKRMLEFHGFIKFGWPIKGHREDAFDESTNIFDQTELTLWMGIDILKNLSFTSEVEFEDGFNEFTFEKFEFDWNIFKDLATFKFGKFIYPFGIERLVEDAPFNKLISRPTPSKRIIPGTYSDNGIELYGIVPLISTMQLKYELALTAGLSGPSRKGEQNLSENNDSKTLGGRLGFVIFPGLEIGGSYSTGKYDDRDKLRIDFIGFDLAFQKGGFELRGEYVRSNVEGDGITTESFDRDGYYVQTSYKYMPELNYLRYLEGVVRFDSVDPNDLITNESDTDRVSFGINYSPLEHFEFKLEYILENESKENLEKNLLFQTILRW